MFSRFKRKDKQGGGDGANPNSSETQQPASVNSSNNVDEEPETEAPLGHTDTTATKDLEYPSGLRLVLLMSSIFISMFLVALDRLIISTAIPQITNDFHSVTDIGWYGAAYLLTNCAFQLMYGKLYTFFAVKGVFLTAIFLFEAGSAICGAAPNSVAFIIGRAIAGLGSAGIMSGAIVTIVYAIPLHKRPLYQGLFGAVFGISSIIGPLVGGAFTSNVTWRWCFYINLPFGGVAAVFIAFLLKVPDREETKLDLKSKILQLDLMGTTVFLPGVICLLLALQWGGFEYPWNDGRIIALLVLGGVLLIAFVAIQILKPDTATVPPRIFNQRSIMSGTWVTFCIGSSMMIFIYFLPVWFQAIKAISAIDSGIRLLPMVLPMVFMSIMIGALTSRVGYYTPSMLFGIVLMSIGAGLLNTLQVDSSQAHWAGYQVIYGLGLGCTFQAPNLAAQTVLKTKDVPVGTALMFFTQTLGGAIFISVGQNVLNSELLKRLTPLPGFPASALGSLGATELIAHVPEAIRGRVVFEYNEALRKVFQVGLILTCLIIVGGVFMEWRSVKKNVQPKEEAGAAEEGKAKGVVTDGEDVDAKGRDTDGEETTGTIGGGEVASEKGDEVKGAPKV
ncbi:putative MFS aflatoxin efflux pump [Apodospora peruviana]|uniref:MFS aflatoxin efflux pump n=1 Tax=Apodospora peruviana TaxID=516989 RepID=A0AAE0IK30_9PEZI|nr:putative MFS aflatoxin efflux pump [Apodospora peruviana]